MSEPSGRGRGSPKAGGARKREGGAAKREAQGARSRGRSWETAGGAHARAGIRGRRRGLRKPAGRGRPGAEPEADQGRGHGRASTLRGGVRRGGDALAGWGRRGRGGGGSVPGFRPCFPLSFHLRPAAAVDSLRSPVPWSRPAAAASSLRSRRARQSPRCALLRLGHGWVSARRRGGRAGLRLPRFLSALVRTCRGRGAGRGVGGRGAAPAEPDGGASGRLLGELELRRGGPPQPRLPPRGAPVISAPHSLAPGSGGEPV